MTNKTRSIHISSLALGALICAAVGLPMAGHAQEATKPGAPQATLNKAVVAAQVSQVDKNFAPLAPKSAPLDLAPPGPSTPPLPNVSSYSEDLEQISANQRAYRDMETKDQIVSEAVNVDKGLLKLKLLNDQLSGKAPIDEPGATARPGMPNAPMASAGQPMRRAPEAEGPRPMEVLDLGGISGRAEATLYVSGVGPVSVHVGSELPGGVQVTSITESGVGVAYPDGSRHLVGLGDQLSPEPSSNPAPVAMSGPASFPTSITNMSAPHSGY